MTMEQRKPDSIKETARQSWIKEISDTGIKFGNQEFREKITQLLLQPEKFLGFGGAAAVFDLDNQCIKIIRNRWQSTMTKHYNLGRNPRDEYRIQHLTNDLTVENVRSPRVFRCDFSGNNEFAAIYMERLDAIELTNILRGIEPPPSGFSPESYFDGLQAYIYTLHGDFSIIHGDLAPRNVMVDRTTGDARVIDFGRASYYTNKPADFDNRSQVDEQGLDKIEKALDGLQ